MTSDVTRDGCSQVVDLLVDYLEDNLASGTRQDLERHLTACDSCVQQLRTYELRHSVAAFLDGQTVH